MQASPITRNSVPRMTFRALVNTLDPLKYFGVTANVHEEGILLATTSTTDTSDLSSARSTSDVQGSGRRLPCKCGAVSQLCLEKLTKHECVREDCLSLSGACS